MLRSKIEFFYFCRKVIEMRKHTLCILLLVVLASFSASAQKNRYSSIVFSQHHFVDTVKIRVWDGAVIIPVEINGETKNLMFDTGAGRGFWIGEEEEWMTPSGNNITVTDASLAVKKKAIMRMPPIKMGNITIENYPMVVDNGLSDYICDRFDGALGFDLAACGLSFKFDTKDSLMIVTDRKGFFSKEEEKWPAMKYKWYHKTNPKVWVQFPFFRVKVLFDSGAMGGWVDLSEEFMTRWAAAAPKLRQRLDEVTVLQDTTVFNTAGLFGRLEDTIPYRIFHFPEVEMGGITLKDVWVSTDKRLGKVGSSILEHNSLIINGHKRCLVLMPHEDHTVQHVGNEDTKGLKLILADKSDTLGVLKAVVRKDGEAYRKGIRSGDYLESVNGISITDYCTYLHLIKEDGVQHCVFRSPEGTRKEVEW